MTPESKTVAAARSLQLCPTLCDPRDDSPPGSTVPGILQARTLEWVAISFSNAWNWKVKVKSLSHVWLLATPWTAAYQTPPPMGFSRQEYWSGLCICYYSKFIYFSLFFVIVLLFSPFFLSFSLAENLFCDNWRVTCSCENNTEKSQDPLSRYLQWQCFAHCCC